MTPERSGQDRREGWGPLCELHDSQTGKITDIHDELLTMRTENKTNLRNWGVFLSLLLTLGLVVAGWAFVVVREDAKAAVAMVVKQEGVDKVLERLVAQDKALESRVGVLENRQSEVMQRLSRVETRVETHR